jgi:hypothetical protein
MSRAKAAIAFYVNYQERHNEADIRAGERAFREGLDAEGATKQLEIVEDGVIAACQADAAAYNAHFKSDVGPLASDIESTRKRLNDVLRKQELNLNQRHAANLANLGGVWGGESPRQSDARAKIEQLEQQESFVLAEVDGRPPSYGKLWFYGLILFVLACAEVPVNRPAFELFFRETPLLATLVASLCGLILVFLSHAGGKVLRQFHYYAAKSTPAAPLFSLCMIFLIVLVLAVGLALLRQGYVDFILNRAANPGFAAMLEQGEYRAAIFQVAANGLRADGYVFLTINLAIVAVGVIASYYKHDAHPFYEKIDRGLKAERQRLAEIQATHAEKEAQLTSRYNDAMRGVLRNISDSEARLTKLEADLLNKDKERQADLETVRMVMRRRVLGYREGFCGTAAAHGVLQIATRPIPGLMLPPGETDHAP